GLVVLFSGIGCHTPHYRDIDGMRVIHGLEPSAATGLARNRPDLSVWVAIRDGHTMMAGGNSLITAMHSNVNVKILLYDNQPDPLSLQCEISFLARVEDSDQAAVTDVLAAAGRHRG